MTTRRLRLLLALLAFFGLVAAGCGSDDDTSTAATTTTAAATATVPKLSGAINVLAASSLTDAFNALGAAFSEANPDVKVNPTYNASSTLVTNITEGAPADVFASADTANMTKLTDGSLVGTPTTFATNSLQIVVQKGNPKGIATVADLANPDVIYVTAAPEVPIAKYAAQVLEKAGVTVTPKSLEPNVKAIVTKVATLKEADAGIVYITDVKAEPAAEGVVIPADLDVVATYPIAVTEDTENAEVAEAFVAFVMSAEGQAILAGFGFGEP